MQLQGGNLVELRRSQPRSPRSFSPSAITLRLGVLILRATIRNIHVVGFMHHESMIDVEVWNVWESVWSFNSVVNLNTRLSTSFHRLPIQMCVKHYHLEKHFLESTSYLAVTISQ
jgi:hypothetical protein